MLYYVDHPSRFDRNTGIQRCVRSIAKALLALQVPLRPVVWNRSEQDLFWPRPMRFSTSVVGVVLSLRIVRWKRLMALSTLAIVGS